MKEIESFTAVATVLNTERCVRWSSLDGLTIEGLTRADASAVMRLIESVSERARQQAQSVSPSQSLAPDEVPPPERAESPAPAQDRAPLAAPASEPLPRPENTAAKVPRRSVAPPDNVVGRIPAAVDAARIEPTGEGNESKKKKSAAPKKMSKKASPTKSSWKEPQTGDIFEGAVVTSVKPTVAGGAKVFLKNGVMVVFDDKGTELMRTDTRQKAASPPALQVATDIAGESAPPPKEDVLSVPDEVMKTRMTRDVLKWLLDKGVTDRDQIIAECERLKQNGAVAFSTCPDVRQRASTVLTAMGVA